MKQKLKEITNKIGNYFKDKKISKKEGLYIAIFTAVCVALISGVVVLKQINTNKDAEVQKQKDKEVSLNIPKEEEKEVDIPVMENSDRVKAEEKEKPVTKPVTSTPKLSFMNPVEGKVVKAHDATFVSEDKMRTDIIGGVAIESKLGTEVKAAEVGVVESVNTKDVRYGTEIIVKHPNGIKTAYANLDASVTVKEGDKVTKGQIIGKVGKTAQGLTAYIKGDFAYIRVLENNEKLPGKNSDLDPAKYFSFKK